MVIHGFEFFLGGGVLSFVVCFFDPGGEDVAVFFELRGVGGVGGEVFGLVGVGAEVVEFFGGSLVGIVIGGLEGSEFFPGVECAEGFEGGVFFAVLELVERSVGEEVLDVAVVIGADGADSIDGDAEAIACTDDEGAWLEIFREKVLAFDVIGAVVDRVRRGWWRRCRCR